MSRDITQRGPAERVLWTAEDGDKVVGRWSRERGLWLIYRASNGVSWDFLVPSDAIEDLRAMIAEGPAEPELVLGIEDEVAPAAVYRACPICLKANPCDRHSLAAQIRAVADPEYLESVVPPCDLRPQPSECYGSGCDEFPIFAAPGERKRVSEMLRPLADLKRARGGCDLGEGQRP